jgi:acyl carrier protein
LPNIIKEETVLAELKSAIAGALGVDESLILPGSVLSRDLGAESLDFLDINYHLEQSFGFKMARYSMLVHAEELFGEGSVIDGHGRLTKEAIVLLEKRFGRDAPQLRVGMDLEEVLALVTVQSVVNAVMEILDTLPEKCTHCDQSAWHSIDGKRVVCSSCGEEATYVSGDDFVRSWLTTMQQEDQIFK